MAESIKPGQNAADDPFGAETACVGQEDGLLLCSVKGALYSLTGLVGAGKKNKPIILFLNLQTYSKMHLLFYCLNQLSIICHAASVCLVSPGD